MERKNGVELQIDVLTALYSSGKACLKYTPTLSIDTGPTDFQPSTRTAI
jgi:hypothetical protein